jgi:hypothetical protein
MMDVPICAVCERPVSQFIFSSDINRRISIYIARCHGAEQRVELSDLDVMCAGPHGVSVTRAFDAPKLEK